MWCIAVFGFAAALLETLPFIGLIFSISNQVEDILEDEISEINQIDTN